MFRSILAQLVLQVALSPDPDVTRLERMSRRYGRDAFSLQYLGSEIRDISGNFNHTYVVLDGIDEYLDRAEVFRFLHDLEEAKRDSRRLDLRVLITSQPEPDIIAAFDTKPRYTLDMSAVKGDIAKYVAWNMENDKRLWCIKGLLKEEIRRQLIDKSDGM